MEVDGCYVQHACVCACTFMHTCIYIQYKYIIYALTETFDVYARYTFGYLPGEIEMDTLLASGTLVELAKALG